MNCDPLTSPFISLSIHGFSYSFSVYTPRSFLLLILILRLLLLSLRILLFNSSRVYNPSLSDILLREKRWIQDIISRIDLISLDGILYHRYTQWS
jgi:hypothetical protein